MDFKELFLSLDQPVTKNQIFVVVSIGKNCWPVFFMKNNKKVNKVTGWFSKRNISHRNYERRWFQIFVELWFGKAQNWEDWQFQSSVWKGVPSKKYQYFYLKTVKSQIFCIVQEFNCDFIKALAPFMTSLSGARLDVDGRTSALTWIEPLVITAINTMITSYK